MVPLCLHLALTPASSFVFDRIDRAHSSLSSASFTAVSNLTGAGQPAQSKFNIAYRWPNEFRMRILDPRSGAILRERCIETSRVVEYDPSLLQYTSTPRKSGQTPGSILAELDKGLDDLILAFTTEKGFSVWLAPILQNKPWTVGRRGSNAVLTFARKERRIVVQADSTTGRLTKIDITTGPQTLSWTLTYARDAQRLAFAPPPGSIEVPIFDRESKPPKYADAKSKAVANRLFAAYSDLSSLGYYVYRDKDRTTVKLRGKFARQDDAIAEWTYDGRTLIVHVKKTDKWYRGELGFPDVVDSVGGLGTRVDPTLRLLMTGFNPYRRRLGDGAMLKVVGSMKISGQPVTMLEASSDNALITLFIRDSDGLVVSSSTRAKETSTIDDSTVDLRYEYFAVANDLAQREKLTIPQGASVTKLFPKKIN